MSEAALRDRFTFLWTRLGAGGKVAPHLDTLLRGWHEPHRAYHGPDHLRDCLGRLDEAAVTGSVHDLAEVALWYHDVVYQPGAPDNEARSAELAESIARRWPALRFRLAQSVEPQLPTEESWAGASRTQLREQLERWRTRLQPAGITGVDWQDWTHFPR